MLEESPKDKEGKSNAFLQKIRLLLKDCYSIDKTKCPYPNTRVHWTDVRLDGSLFRYTEILLVYNGLQSSIISGEIDLRTIEGQNFVKDIYNKFIQILKDANSQFSIDGMLKDTKILKQIENIQDANIRNKILLEISNSIRFSHDIFTQLLNQPGLEFTDYKFFKSLLNFTAVFTDAYLVSRILRNFKDIEMKNFIVYTGGAHSDKISKLLKSVGYETAASTDLSIHDRFLDMSYAETDFCLDITHMMPLFG